MSCVVSGGGGVVTARVGSWLLDARQTDDVFGELLHRQQKKR